MALVVTKKYEVNMKAKKSKVDIKTLAQNLEQDARNGNIEHALDLLNQNKVLIKNLHGDQSKIIEYFYLPYSVAYEESKFDFCSQYQKTLNELSGLDSALFNTEDY